MRMARQAARHTWRKHSHSATPRHISTEQQYHQRQQAVTEHRRRLRRRPSVQGPLRWAMLAKHATTECHTCYQEQHQGQQPQHLEATATESQKPIPTAVNETPGVWGRTDPHWKMCRRTTSADIHAALPNRHVHASCADPTVKGPPHCKHPPARPTTHNNCRPATPQPSTCHSGTIPQLAPAYIRRVVSVKFLVAESVAVAMLSACGC
jgi:hypothetical protein